MSVAELNPYVVTIWIILTAGISFLVNIATIKAKRKSATASARSVEIHNENEVAESYRKLWQNATEQYTRAEAKHEERYRINQEQIASLRREIDKMNKKLTKSIEKNNFLDMITNQAYRCTHGLESCPVLNLKQELLSKMSLQDIDYDYEQES